MAFPYRTGECRYLFLCVRCFYGNTRYRHLRNEQFSRRLVFQPSIGGVQKTGEAIKEAVGVLRSIIRRKRIGKLRSRISAASGGAFIDFALDDNGIISCVKQRRDIPCVSVSGIHISIRKTWGGVFHPTIFKMLQGGSSNMSR